MYLAGGVLTRLEHLRQYRVSAAKPQLPCTVHRDYGVKLVGLPLRRYDAGQTPIPSTAATSVVVMRRTRREKRFERSSQGMTANVAGMSSQNQYGATTIGPWPNSR